MWQEAGNGNGEFSVFGFKRHGTCCVPRVSVNRALALACAIRMWPNSSCPLKKQGYEMSPGCKTQPQWGGLGCAWERGWGDNVAVPTPAGPGLAEQGGEVFSVTVTLDLQNFQFLRGIKAPRGPRWCAARNHAVPKKSVWLSGAQIIHKISSRGRWTGCLGVPCEQHEVDTLVTAGDVFPPKYPIPCCFPPEYLKLLWATRCQHGQGSSCHTSSFPCKVSFSCNTKLF